jgi:hypothetical protein
MRLREIASALGLQVRCAERELDREVRGGYAGDLMSDVLAHAEAGDLWVTMQAHANTVAVAMLKDLAGIVLVGGREPEAATLSKAGENGMPILVSRLPAFELIGRLYGLGIGGRRPDAGEV